MTTIGRILFAIPFLVLGFWHFTAVGEAARMVPGGIPAGAFWNYFTGTCGVAAGIAFISTFKGKLAAQLMAVLLLVSIVMVDLRAMFSSPIEVGPILKVSLLGGCLMLAGIFRRQGQ